MGIRGTVRRSNDPWFVHCNVDTDVLVWEGDSTGGLRCFCVLTTQLSSLGADLLPSHLPPRRLADPSLKPPELQTLIENFCLGTRRLHLYGSPHSLRRGWLTVGVDFTSLDPSSFSSDEPHLRPVEGEKTEWRVREYERESFEALWASARPALAIGMGGMEVEVQSEAIESLLPYVEGEF